MSSQPVSRRTAAAALGAGLLAGPALVRPALALDTIRIGLPTKTFWPTVVTQAALRQGFFAKEGIGAEPTAELGALAHPDRLFRPRSPSRSDRRRAGGPYEGPGSLDASIGSITA